MASLKLTLDDAELGLRLRERLGGAQPVRGAWVVWEKEQRRVLLNLASVKSRFADGWLVCELDLKNDQVGRETLQFVFFLGTEREARGTQAAATINAATPDAAQLADQWGADLQRVLWDAVLDAIEAAVAKADRRRPGEKLTLRGFHCTSDALHVEVLTGEL